ncbi:MAG: AAA family ATPase [Chloroflexi bacterium]|nr:AAA family ATPase [Chloroflexota bacterium]
MTADVLSLETDFKERLLSLKPLDLCTYESLLRTRYPETEGLFSIPGLLDHTQQVMEAVRANAGTLDTATAQALYLAALLHAVGQSGDQLSDSIGVTVERAREVCFRLGIKPSVRDDVVYLVRHQHIPWLYGVRHYNVLRYLQLSAMLNTQALYLLARADIEADGERSRIRSTHPLEAFRRTCEEAGVFGQRPQIWLSEEDLDALGVHEPDERLRLRHEVLERQLRGLFDNPAQARAWVSAIVRRPHGTLYLTVGVPGSGKTTWVQQSLPGVRRISMDDQRELLLGSRSDQSLNPEVFRACSYRLHEALARNETVIWDAQSHTLAQRRNVLRAARGHHATVIIIHFDVPLCVALERNRMREFAVPDEVIIRSYRRLLEPRDYEAEEIRRIIA